MAKVISMYRMSLVFASSSQKSVPCAAAVLSNFITTNKEPCRQKVGRKEDEKTHWEVLAVEFEALPHADKQVQVEMI